MANVRAAATAGPKLASPGCDAVTVHEPAPVMVTVWSTIVQLSAAPTAKATGRPDEEVAATSNGPLPKVRPGSAAKVTVCAAGAITSVPVAGVAVKFTLLSVAWTA